jgi:hypothetical protein
MYLNKLFSGKICGNETSNSAFDIELAADVSQDSFTVFVEIAFPYWQLNQKY